MANPIKKTADFFSHDVDMRNDLKIKALRRKYSHKGYAVWCYLLEALSNTSDFKIEFSELNIELLSADFDVPSDELKDIIGYCIKIGLLIEDCDVFFSEKLIERFSSLIEKRSQKSLAGKKGMENRWRDKRNVINDLNKNSDNRIITEVQKGITENNIVKKSKVKKSKEKKSPSIPLTENGKGKDDEREKIISALSSRIPNDFVEKDIDTFRRLSSDFRDPTVISVLKEWLSKSDKPSEANPRVQQWFEVIQHLQLLAQQGKIKPPTYKEWQYRRFYENITESDRIQITELIRGSTSLNAKLDRLIEICLKPDSQIVYPARYVISELKRC